MRRKQIQSIIRTQKHDASCISPKYGKRAKRQGAKSLRQVLKHEQSSRGSEVSFDL